MSRLYLLQGGTGFPLLPSLPPSLVLGIPGSPYFFSSANLKHNVERDSPKSSDCVWKQQILRKGEFAKGCAREKPFTVKMRRISDIAEPQSLSNKDQ